MLPRSKLWDLTRIIFWLLSVGRISDGSVNDDKGRENVMLINSDMNEPLQKTTSSQETLKRSASDLEDEGGGGTTFEDFMDEDDEDPPPLQILHKQIESLAMGSIIHQG